MLFVLLFARYVSLFCFFFFMQSPVITVYRVNSVEFIEKMVYIGVFRHAQLLDVIEKTRHGCCFTKKLLHKHCPKYK